MKRSRAVGWAMLAGVLGILHYLTGQSGGFAGYLVSLGLVVAVSIAFRLGPFMALLSILVATLLIAFIGGYLGIITGNHPREHLEHTVFLDVARDLFFPTIA